MIRRRRPGAQAVTTTIPIDSIKIGSRHRRDLGDIAGLAESIADIGLLHPITVDEDGRLLAGVRRLVACKRLGWNKISVNTIRRRG
jgi:ParB family chromosome partitioning protein